MAERPRGGRVKKYYEATELGRSVFVEWLSAPIDPNLDGNALLAMIYFYGVLPTELRNQRLGELEAFQQQALAQLRAIEKSVHTDCAEEEDYFMLSTLYLGLQSTLGVLRWIRYIRDQKPLSQFIQEETTA